jgi:hypothetical protein
MAALNRAVACGLIGLSTLHVAWGLGSSFPFASRDELADAVIGTPTVPSPSACFTVAAGLAAGSAFLLDPIPMPRTVRRSGLLGMSLAFGARAVLGWSGHTDKVSPGSNSVRFRRLDRRLYSPICACLAAGTFAALREPKAAL